MKIACVLTLLVLLSQVGAFAQEPTPTVNVASNDDVRAALTKSLVYLDKAGQTWIDTKKCVTCHRVSFLTWSYREADRKGIELPNNKFNEWLSWSIEDTTKPLDKSKPIACQINHDGIGQMLIAHAGEGPGGLTAEQREKLVQGLLSGQRDDGSWKPGGQLPAQKRPLPETTQVSMLWNIIALGSVPPDEKVHTARERGLAALEKMENGKSTEWYVANLLLAVQQKNDEQIKHFREQLRQLQQDDGGWGWLTADPSDALGTGQALYALRIAGVPADDAALQRSVQFLLSTQQPDGSWSVKGTKENRKES